jgi:hypothetical protein
MNTINRANAPNQPERIAISHQKAQRSLELLACKVVRPPVEPAGRRHR